MLLLSQQEDNAQYNDATSIRLNQAPAELMRINFELTLARAHLGLAVMLGEHLPAEATGTAKATVTAAAGTAVRPAVSARDALQNQSQAY